MSFWTSVLWAHLGPLWNRLGLEPCDKWLLGDPPPPELVTSATEMEAALQNHRADGLYWVTEVKLLLSGSWYLGLTVPSLKWPALSLKS